METCAIHMDFIIIIFIIFRWHFLHSQTEAPDSDVMRRVRRAKQQLLNSKDVISHVISDVAQWLSIRTTLFLPFVSSKQLHRVLTDNPALGQVRKAANLISL
jgi:hypothetical protein